MRRLDLSIRPSTWLCLAAGIAFTAAYPGTRGAWRLGDHSPPAAVGPFCLLTGAPTLATTGIWHLEYPEDILPFDLLLAGYPEASSGDHRVVARVACTAYTSCICETDSTPDLTASLTAPQRGTIALSRDLLREFTPGAPFRFGDQVELIGVGVFRVEDTMAPRWHRRADIWLPTREEASIWGRRTVLVARFSEHPEDVALLAPSSRDET
jgi:3D (Asp-Asp-Asp) domain-containing protein